MTAAIWARHPGAALQTNAASSPEIAPPTRKRSKWASWASMRSKCTCRASQSARSLGNGVGVGGGAGAGDVSGVCAGPSGGAVAVANARTGVAPGVGGNGKSQGVQATLAMSSRQAHSLHASSLSCLVSSRLHRLSAALGVMVRMRRAGMIRRTRRSPAA